MLKNMKKDDWEIPSDSLSYSDSYKSILDFVLRGSLFPT